MLHHVHVNEFDCDISSIILLYFGVFEELEGQN